MAKKKLVALCACTMGLAHTFMAAQALEDAAKE
ncbi:MAG: PTS fructose transporter subunit IIB, partial [Lacrimispora sphenoides]